MTTLDILEDVQGWKYPDNHGFEDVSQYFDKEFDNLEI